MNKVEILKKIMYRSKSLGYRELSLIFKSFLEKNLENLDFNELNALMDFINMDDKKIMDYILGDINDIPEDNIIRKFVHFAKSLND